jgi:uncharacterized membrane protein YdjX (TVP38/TMEM64 family)
VLPKQIPKLGVLVVGVLVATISSSGRSEQLPPAAAGFQVDVQASLLPPVQQDREEAFVDRFGQWSLVLAPLLMIVVAILPVPAEFPAMLNGMIFGPLIGTTITWLGAIVGAWISFELARRFGRPFTERFVKPTLLERADRAVDSAGWPGLLTLRLIPAVAFTALNWGAGLTTVPRWTFLWTTTLGILPGAIVFTVSGTGVAALFRANPLAAVGLGFVVFLVAWWTVVRYRRRRAVTKGGKAVGR